MKLTAFPLLAIALLLLGCGTDDGSQPPADLAAFLPEGSQQVSLVDVDAAREELGLAEDADPLPTDFDEPPERDTPEATLYSHGSFGFTFYRAATSETFDPSTGTPLDGTQVSALADTLTSDGSATIVQTSEPFDEVEKGLEQDGYEASGDSWVAGDDTVGSAADVVRDGGDGLVVFASEAAIADEIAERINSGESAQAGSAADIAGSVEGAVRTATAADAGECVTGFALSQDAEGSRGEMALLISGGNAEAERVDPGAVETVGLGEAEADADRVVIPFESAEDSPFVVAEISANLLPFDVYDCG